jgi:zinc transporter 1/2/3
MEHNVTEAPTHPEGDEEGIVTAKVVSMVAIFVGTFLLGMLPRKLSTWFGWSRKKDGGVDTSDTSQLILSLLIFFGGGALLCTMFLHMLPEVKELITDLQEEGEIAETSFSLPEFIMCCGFFLVYLVEEVTHHFFHGHGHGHDHGHSTTVPETDKVIRRSISIRKYSTNSGNIQNDIEDTQKGREDSSPPVLTISTLKEAESNETKTVIPSHMPKFDEDNPVASSLRGLLLIVALSVHEIFEGLAIGLQTSTSYVWYMLGAVSSHELVIAFCVGIELVSCRTRFILTLVYISAFALILPLGIGIGIGLSQGEAHGGAPNAILQGISTGTLLYVVFFEVLQKQRNTHESGLLRLLAIITGFGLMFGLRIAGKIASDCMLIHWSEICINSFHVTHRGLFSLLSFLKARSSPMTSLYCHCVFKCVLSCQFRNHLADFHDLLHDHYATGGHSNVKVFVTSNNQ